MANPFFIIIPSSRADGRTAVRRSMADASLSTVLPANVLTLTFATRAFSPKAKQIEFVTSRNVIVPKPRRWLRPVPAWLVLPEELLDLIAQFLLRMLASAGMYARCSWAFKGAVTRAARLLEMDEHIIYWTGNSPPMSHEAAVQ